LIPFKKSLSEAYKKQADFNYKGETKNFSRLATLAKVRWDIPNSSLNIENSRIDEINMDNRNVSNDDDEVLGDAKDALELEKSDLFTFKLELKGESNVHQRHLHLHKINNGEQQLLEVDPSKNMDKLDNIQVKYNFKPPEIEFKNEMGPNISPFQLKNQTGKVLPQKGLIPVGLSNSSLEKENIKDKKEDKVRTLALNFEVLASEEKSQNHKS